MAVSRGDPIPEECNSDGKIVAGFLTQLPVDDGSQNLSSSDEKKGLLLRADETGDSDLDFCSDAGIDDLRPADYLFGRVGGIVRGYVALDTPTLEPECHNLGILNYRVNMITGATTGTSPTSGTKLHYRGEFYPSWYDPTHPDTGGSGWNGYTTWAFKRGSGGGHGVCSVGFVSCGTHDYASQGQGDIIQTGSIVDGVIVGFPANDSFTEIVNFDAVITGCCTTSLAGLFFSMAVFYYFCVYPEGVDPTGDLGP